MDEISRIVMFNDIAGNPRLPRRVSDDLISLYASLIDEEYREFDEAFEYESVSDILDACGDLIVVCAGLISALGYEPNQVLKNINDSNMSKFCDNEEEAIASVESYKDSNRYVDVTYQKVMNRYVILGKKIDNPEAGMKILKGVNYKDPESFNLYDIHQVEEE